jgi:hypothetical protein
MKVFANAAMMLGAVVLMGWLMVAQGAYQQGFNENSTAQASTANQTNLADSMGHAMLALN